MAINDRKLIIINPLFIIIIILNKMINKTIKLVVATIMVLDSAQSVKIDQNGPVTLAETSSSGQIHENEQFYGQLGAAIGNMFKKKKSDDDGGEGGDS